MGNMQSYLESLGNQQTYQELRDRMDQWGVLRPDCSSGETLDRLRVLEALVRDMLDVALSEKNS